MTELTSSASKAIAAALQIIQDPEVRQGLQDAQTLIGKALPELYTALSEAIDSLGDASSVVDAGEDEEYAYQRPLEEGRETLRRFEEGTYEKGISK